ncbi:hypothetical protein BCR36DRAFT_369523 [Piromyces finnis]|uniref:WD40 repeat-like protein n=1 Tax=Piromyces finnis TaxID=1754191 RepID=A0A1Y1VBL5_9FUNG|nr:hypothetical protein BCR36DRAFT_369523 [Piromyces finnis]|eukprot:ORX52147.1 hypothetical protein BCR36DRAFT_369523 [Piromyces finnis]
MEKRKIKSKTLIDFTNKNISLLDITQKLKEISNDIKETSVEVESYEKLFKKNTRYSYNTQVETKSEYLNDIFIQISGANSDDILKIAKYELSKIKANQRKEQEIRDEKKEKFNKELRTKINQCKEKYEIKMQTNRAGPSFENFLHTTNGEIIYVDIITEYLYLIITFQGIIEIWEIDKKENKITSTLKYIESIDCNGITNACKLTDTDMTDYKSVNDDFKIANKTTNGKNFKTNYINQLNAQNIENETTKISSIISYKNSIIYNLVSLARNNETNNRSKYNRTGLKVISEIYMLLAQYKYYFDLQEEKKKKNNLKLVDAYKLNASENTINKYDSSYSVNYSELINNGLSRINKKESMLALNSNETKNKTCIEDETEFILNKVIIKLKSSFFLGNINGIGVILNIIISENIITGDYVINHYIGHQYQLSVLPILLSEYNSKDNLLSVPIYNELKEPYLMTWSMPNFNIEWICKLSTLSDIEYKITITNVASDEMIFEDKLKQYVKVKNPSQNLDYQDITAISFDRDNLSYVLAMKKGLVIELKWNVNNGATTPTNSLNEENNNSETSNSQVNENENNVVLNVIDENNKNSINIENNNDMDNLTKKILTAKLLIKIDPCISDILIDKTEEFINGDDINNEKYIKKQSDIEKLQIIPISMKINRSRFSEPKKITVGCSDGSLRIYNYSNVINKYIEVFHYEVGQENIENNKTSSYDKNSVIKFKDKEEKTRMLKWKSIKNIYRSNIMGLTISIDNFILTIGYTNNGISIKK